MSRQVQPHVQRTELLEIARQALAREFDPSINLVGQAPHYLPPSICYVWCLIEVGDGESVRTAEAILDIVLTDQEMRPGAPDFGHFRMLFEDSFIADLNAVQLMLIELIPLALQHGDRLTPGLHDRLLASIRAGLAALDAIAAHLTYSNVAVLDVANRILGGEVVGDVAAVTGGVDKLAAFVEYTNRHGGIRDFNSPSYLVQMLTTLATLATYAGEATVRRQAELLQERLWLQAITHYHPSLGQLAGPYSRAYPADVVGASGHVRGILGIYLGDEPLAGQGLSLDRLGGSAAVHLATRDYYVPAYLADLLRGKAYPYRVRESADRDFAIGLTSYLGAHHCLGTASVGFGSQARNLIVHGAPRAGLVPKVLYSRYLAQGEERDLNVRDPRMAEWGLFAGLQHGPRAIALYGAPLDYRRLDALRLELYLLGADSADVVWSGGQPMAPGTRLPAGHWLVFDLGATYVAIFLLEPTHLGGDPDRPVSLHREEGGLRLAIENYAGPAKHFWQYAPIPWEYRSAAIGPFFNGNLRAGVLVETADAADWPDATSFQAAVTAARVHDQVTGGVRRVQFEREGQALALAVDLRSFTAVERLVDGQPEPEVALSAPDVVQLLAGANDVDGHTVVASAAGPWLALAGAGYAVANPTPTAITLTLDGQSIRLPGFARGHLQADGVLTLDTAHGPR